MTNPNEPNQPFYWVPDGAMKISDDALRMVRYKKDNTDTERVKHIKLLAGAFITLAQDTAVVMPWNARQIALAITNAENAAMWLEKACDP